MAELRLSIDPEQLGSCVGCGLCLPHCPTFRVTGEEAYSPRGRIDAMRGVHDEGTAVDDEFVEFMESCVQCRGCEPACPSSVPFGDLMEQTRRSLAEAGRVAPRWQRWAFAVLPRHRLLLAGSTMLAVAQRARLVPSRLGLGRLPIRRPSALQSTGDDVWLFTGCVMDAWQRSTHHSAAALVTAAGATFRVPRSGAGCCGALHVHTGLHEDAVRLAGDVIAAMPGDRPILVDSAGCGAALKDYGRLIGTPEAAAFAERVVDVTEWLAEHADRLPGVTVPTGSVVVQDPCHLRHVQRVEGATRTILGLVSDVVELDDDGLCCGAGGAYSVLQPGLAGEIRGRKLAGIERAASTSGATLVASANPGCSMHLAPGLEDLGIGVAHPVDIVAEALGLR